MGSPDPRSGVRHLEALNEGFARVGVWSYDHRSVVLLVCLALLAGCAWLAAETRFDNSVEGFFDQNDETYTAYRRYRAEFGSDEIAYLVYQVPGSRFGPFDLDALRKIKRLTRALEDEVPFVKKVTSLTNVELIEGVPDGLEVQELFEEIPESQQAALAVREKVLHKPLYVGSLVSEDASNAAIIVEMDRSTVDPVEELRLDPDGGDGLANLYPQVSYQAIERVIARPEYDGIVFEHAGDVPMNAIYNELVESESNRLMGIAFAAIGALLFYFFRSLIGVVGPLLVVALSIAVSVAAIGALGWKLDMMFIMLPVLLIAVGVADAVHIIAEFRALHAELGDRREAIRRTLRLVGTPCLLTSLTTAAGFAAMSIAPITAISHLGIYSAIGVVAAFVLSITLLLVVVTFGRGASTAVSTGVELARAKGGRRFQAALAGIADFDLRHRRGILLASLAIFAFSAAGLARLEVDSNFLTEFKPDEPIRVVTEYVDDVMGGSLSLIYLFDSGAPEGVKDPLLLADVDRLQTASEQQEIVKHTTSITDLLKEINRSFHAEDDDFYELPDQRDLVGQYMLLYEMSGGEDLDDYVTGDLREGQLALRTRAVEISRLREVSNALQETISASPRLASSVTLTGMGALWLKLQEYITQSQIRGFALAFSAIAAMLCLLFRSLKTGLIAMIPNLAPVVLCLGVMGWLDIPLDYVRLLIGSVAIGISVDDTIHLVTRYRLDFEKSGSYEQALRSSMTGVGRALFITSAALVGGFAVFTFAALDTYVTFGALLAGTISVALVADFLLMPVLVLTFRPFGPEGPERA